MRIAFVQTSVCFGEVETNVRKAVDRIRGSNADLFVLPELFNTGYYFLNRSEAEGLAEEIPSGETCRVLAKVAKEKSCFIVAGLAEKAGNRLFNSSILIGPEGYLTTYRKIHLFDEEKLWFDPGDTPFFVIDIGMCKIGMMICFDWIFPESMRTLALQGADVICHSANLVLPYCQDAMVTRCLENNVFAITANRIGSDVREGRKLDFTGKSQITAPGGKILARGSLDSEEVRVVEIDLSAARDKYINSRNHLFNDRRPEMYFYNNFSLLNRKANKILSG